MTELVGIAHASISVYDADRSLHFYRDVVGLDVVSDEVVTGQFVSTVAGLTDAAVRVVLLSAGDTRARLELLQFLHPSPSEGKAPGLPAIGSTHVAFVCRDIHERLRVLEAAEVEVVAPPASQDGEWAMHFLDPDGFRVEFVQLPQKAAGR